MASTLCLCGCGYSRGGHSFCRRENTALIQMSSQFARNSPSVNDARLQHSSGVLWCQGQGDFWMWVFPREDGSMEINDLAFKGHAGRSQNGIPGSVRLVCGPRHESLFSRQTPVKETTFCGYDYWQSRGMCRSLNSGWWVVGLEWEGGQSTCVCYAF